MKNKVVLITGGAGRIGSSLSRAILESGGRVIIPDILMNFSGLTDKAVFMGIVESFYIWSPIEYEKQYIKSQKILREKGPPKLILKKHDKR